MFTGFVFHRIILSGAFGSPIDKGQKVDKTGMLIFSHALINHNPAHLLVPENGKLTIQVILMSGTRTIW